MAGVGLIAGHTADTGRRAAGLVGACHNLEEADLGGLGPEEACHSPVEVGLGVAVLEVAGPEGACRNLEEVDPGVAGLEEPSLVEAFRSPEVAADPEGLGLAVACHIPEEAANPGVGIAITAEVDTAIATAEVGTVAAEGRPIAVDTAAAACLAAHTSIARGTAGTFAAGPSWAAEHT